MSELVLYELTVGNGELAIAGLPGNGGNYLSDLQVIAEWKPALVISLTTLAEMADAGAANLGTELQSLGCRWAHLPVRDFGAPDSEIEKRWNTVGNKAQQALRGGGRVLVHCRGGCGRSGMVALRLMIDAGEKPNTALSRLRAVRACAVETGQQKAWAFAAASESDDP